MTGAESTRERILKNARRMMWARGYSNVSLRDITSSAGVDVALVSRYFDGKRGLFEATLEGAYDIPAMDAASREALVDAFVGAFVAAPRDSDEPSIMRMILANANDEEVGALVRSLHRDTIQTRLEHIIGDQAQAALFVAVLFGMSVAEKTLHLSGIAPPETEAYEAQLRHIIAAALSFEQE